MKKAMIVLAVLALATPALAGYYDSPSVAWGTGTGIGPMHESAAYMNLLGQNATQALDAQRGGLTGNAINCISQGSVTSVTTNIVGGGNIVTLTGNELNAQNTNGTITNRCTVNYND